MSSNAAANSPRTKVPYPAHQARWVLLPATVGAAALGFFGRSSSNPHAATSLVPSAALAWVDVACAAASRAALRHARAEGAARDAARARAAEAAAAVASALCQSVHRDTGELRKLRHLCMHGSHPARLRPARPVLPSAADAAPAELRPLKPSSA